MKDDKLIIRKSNNIVKNTINKFTYKQNQLMCLLLGKYVNLSTNECINTEISIDELRQALKLTDGKNNFERIKNAIDKFGENGSIGIFDSDRNKYIWMPYFTKIELDDTKVLFKWNDEMKPNLINLKNKYTQYLASDYLKLNSIYSQNLYEQLKSIENWDKEIVFTIDDLHRILGTGNKKGYATFNRLKSRCLVPSLEEINIKTDLEVSMRSVKDKKDKRKIYGVIFDINKKQIMHKTETHEAYRNTEQTKIDNFVDNEDTTELQDLINNLKQGSL